MTEDRKLIGCVVVHRDGSRVQTGIGRFYGTGGAKFYRSEGKAKASLRTSNQAEAFAKNPEDFVFIPVYFPTDL